MPSAAVAAVVVALVLAVGVTAPGGTQFAGAPAAASAAVAPAAPAAPRTPDTDAPAPRTVDCRKAKCIALTFDDGPVRQTAKLLRQLKARGARATFFVVGTMARQRPAILRRMIADGDAIGNHSWNHPKFFTMSTKAVRSQIRRTNAVIKRATGTTPRLMRPPYGQEDARVRKIIAGFGQSVALWSIDTQDWKYRNTKKVTKYVVKHARRNAIVLMHDIRPTTRAAVPGIIERLQAKGFTLVTVPELFGGHLKPGRVYSGH